MHLCICSYISSRHWPAGRGEVLIATTAVLPSPPALSRHKFKLSLSSPPPSPPPRRRPHSRHWSERARERESEGRRQRGYLGRPAAGMMRKSYRQLPFENKKPPRGKLMCSESELRVNPPSLGGMTPGQLRDICQGLAENKCVQKLDLDGNQFALGFDGEDALQPLVDLVAVCQLAQSSLSPLCNPHCDDRALCR